MGSKTETAVPPAVPPEEELIKYDDTEDDSLLKEFSLRPAKPPAHRLKNEVTTQRLGFRKVSTTFLKNVLESNSKIAVTDKEARKGTKAKLSDAATALRAEIDLFWKGTKELAKDGKWNEATLALLWNLINVTYHAGKQTSGTQDQYDVEVIRAFNVIAWGARVHCLFQISWECSRLLLPYNDSNAMWHLRNLAACSVELKCTPTSVVSMHQQVVNLGPRYNVIPDEQLGDLMRLGEAQYNAHMFAAAKDTFQKANDLQRELITATQLGLNHPCYGVILRAIGRCQQSLGSNEEALETYIRGAKILLPFASTFLHDLRDLLRLSLVLFKVLGQGDKPEAQEFRTHLASVNAQLERKEKPAEASAVAAPPPIEEHPNPESPPIAESDPVAPATAAAAPLPSTTEPTIA